MSECDVDDIICQLETLKNLRGLRANMGSESMLNRFPELSGMDGKLVLSIQETEGDLKTAIRKCGNIDEEATLEMGSVIDGIGVGDDEEDLGKED